MTRKKPRKNEFDEEPENVSYSKTMANIDTVSIRWIYKRIDILYDIMQYIQ